MSGLPFSRRIDALVAEALPTPLEGSTGLSLPAAMIFETKGLCVAKHVARSMIVNDGSREIQIGNSFLRQGTTSEIRKLKKTKSGMKRSATQLN